MMIILFVILLEVIFFYISVFIYPFPALLDNFKKNCQQNVVNKVASTNQTVSQSFSLYPYSIVLVDELIPTDSAAILSVDITKVPSVEKLTVICVVGYLRVLDASNYFFSFFYG